MIKTRKGLEEGMYLMLQQDKPDVFVLATGRTETVRDFVDMTAKALDMKIEWRGTADNETGVDCASGEVVVEVNPKFYRPAEVELLIGNAAKAEKLLGWKATTSLEELCQIMVESDLRRLS